MKIYALVKSNQDIHEIKKYYASKELAERDKQNYHLAGIHDMITKEIDVIDNVLQLEKPKFIPIYAKLVDNKFISCGIFKERNTDFINQIHIDKREDNYIELSLNFRPKEFGPRDEMIKQAKILIRQQLKEIN
jgi:hypothetical protein